MIHQPHAIREATPDCGSFAFALGKCFLKNCRDTDHSQQFSEEGSNHKCIS
jgi:hypothetical protein